MIMKLRKDIACGALVFIGCLAIGYGGTKYFKKDNPIIVPQDTIVATPEGNQVDDPPKDTNSSVAIINETQPPEKFRDIIDKTSGLGESSIKEHEKPEPKDALMSKEELESLIKNTSDNSLEGFGNDKTANVVEITVIGMQPNEPNRPTRVSDVREKLETNTWKSVKVVSVESDPETGKITSAEVEPIY